ncbi:MAG: NAD(P)/FAD-dependent oxidoreductase [Solirubrobacteraceae bacterium]
MSTQTALPATPDARPDPAVRHFRVAIVGSGFAGLGMAIRLREAGERDFVVLERGTEVGGAWRENTYPGCQCDIPSHLYSLSFALNPAWSHTYSRQPEILAYLSRLATERGVRGHLRLGHEVRCAEWREGDQRWRIETSQGEFTAQILIGALGPLDEPNLPQVEGRERFRGAAFHSARWDHGANLQGKRVAVIGTGASAIQFVPLIQPHVGRLHVFQRTPPWVLPHTDRPVSRAERFLYRRVPAAQRLVRSAVYASRELLVFGFAKRQRLMAIPELLGRAHLRRAVADPELRRRLTPSYRIGCKRILLSNSWYRALQQPNVELHDNAISEIREHSIVTADGREHGVDVIIYGTGFHITDAPASRIIRGADGRTMAEHWGASAQAYLGSTVAGFPNLFLLVGPNTGLGHNSMVYMIESQIAYVLDALRAMSARDAGRVEVRPEAQATYNAELQAKMPGTVWMSGCASWYIDEAGNNTTVWPDFTFRFRRRTSRFEADAYELTGALAGRHAR